MAEYVGRVRAQLQAYLGVDGPVDVAVQRLQKNVDAARGAIIERRAATQARLATLYDLIRRALAIVNELLVVDKLHRRRQLDDVHVELLEKRAETFELKLKAMLGALTVDTYPAEVCGALDRIRAVVKASVERRAGELGAARARVRQYEGIAEFDAVVDEYASVRHSIARQQELIEQLAGGCDVSG